MIGTLPLPFSFRSRLILSTSSLCWPAVIIITIVVVKGSLPCLLKALSIATSLTLDIGEMEGLRGREGPRKPWMPAAILSDMAVIHLYPAAMSVWPGSHRLVCPYGAAAEAYGSRGVQEVEEERWRTYEYPTLQPQPPGLVLPILPGSM